MKRLVAVAVGVSVLSVSALALADVGVVASTVLLRTGPDISSKPIGTVWKGENVTYTTADITPKWVHVYGTGKEGYMSRKALTMKGPKAVKVAQAAKPLVKTASLSTVHPGMTHATVGTMEITPPEADTPAQAPVAEEPPVHHKATRVFEIVPESTPEEVRLQGENAKLKGRVKTLEAQVAELLPLKDEVQRLNGELVVKDKKLAAFRAMFPYVAIIETVEDKGEDVLLTGIGKARMFNSGSKVIVRLENAEIAAGDKAMKRVAKERYLTGSEGTSRAYYVMDNHSIKHTN